MMFGQELNSQTIFKRLAKALISLRVCAGWPEPLLVAQTTLLEISFHGSNHERLPMWHVKHWIYFEEKSVITVLIFG